MVVIKNCPNLSTSHYADGRIIEDECSLEVDKLCQECNTCLIKTIYKKQLDFYYGTHSMPDERLMREILELFGATIGKDKNEIK